MRANGIGGLKAGVTGERGLSSAALSMLAALAISVSASACTGPARTTSAYAGKAADTADQVVSAARTVLLAADIGDARRSFPQTIAVTIADAETDALTARDSFASIQPPDAASDGIRATLLPMVQHACDVIGEVRIAARRADVGELTRIAAPLEPLADDLEGFAARYG